MLEKKVGIIWKWPALEKNAPHKVFSRMGLLHTTILYGAEIGHPLMFLLIIPPYRSDLMWRHMKVFCGQISLLLGENILYIIGPKNKPCCS